MNRFDTTFTTLVQRIAAGELTRQQAAVEAGVPLGTFKSWLSRSGATQGLQHVDGRATPRSTPLAESTPEKTLAYAEAVAECLRVSNPPSVLSVAKKYAPRGVSYKWLLHKVARARTAAAPRPSLGSTGPAQPDTMAA